MTAGLLDRVFRVITLVVATTGLIVIVLAVAAQVFMRYVLSAPLSWSDELARYALVWTTFSGMSLATRYGDHMRVDAVTSYVPERAKTLLTRIGRGLEAVCYLTLLYAGVRMLPVLHKQSSLALDIPMSLIYAAIPMGSAIALLFLLLLVLLRVQRAPK
ncbi:MAG: TRAP transporter small permease [Acidimicrobiia bacterium]